jgi:hypothetical protein
MWLLSAEQAARLVKLQRSRDLQRLNEALANCFPEACTRLGERWPQFIEHGAVRAAAYGLDHLLCVARFLASWIASGAEFESRQPWALAILNDSKRSQGAKAYQLSVRVQEQLRSAPQTGQPTATDYAQVLRQLDQQLANAGTLATLLPRERIRLGAACDIDAVDLRLVETQWRQHYTAQGGPWRREACAPQATSVTLLHDAAADNAPRMPTQISLLSRPASASGTGNGSGNGSAAASANTSANTSASAIAKLRVRVKAEHRCDALLHPLLQCLGPLAERSLRGDSAADITLPVYALAAFEPGVEPHMGEESSPQFSSLTTASCGLRARGVPIGELSTLLAAYDATQYLIAWRREPTPAWQLPANSPANSPTDAAPQVTPARCRSERDGEVCDASAWQQGFEDLDTQLRNGVARLLTAWERESGVSDGKLAVEAALLEGSAGITWGWAEGPLGIAAPPYMRLEGLLDLVACRLNLRFTGALARGGSRSLLALFTAGSASLNGPWQRGPGDALFAVAAKLQVQVRQTFELSVRSLADAGLGVLASAGPPQGVISGAVGLEQRPDGPGLRWFVRLNVEPVVAQLRLSDPLLGVQVLCQPMLPAQAIVDWSLA